MILWRYAIGVGEWMRGYGLVHVNPQCPDELQVMAGLAFELPWILIGVQYERS